MKQIVQTRLHIISATYGPAEGRRLLDGKLVDYNVQETYVPYTRDVLPFLRALMSLATSDDNNDVLQRGGATKSFALMDGRPMNTVFGDCCPGTTKILKVEYIFRDYFDTDDSEAEKEVDAKAKGDAKSDGDGERRRGTYTESRVLTSTFREHERVLLKRQDPLLHLITEDTPSSTAVDLQIPAQTSIPSPPSSPSKRPRTSPCEVTLPLILPFLTIRERAKCQLVCSSWRDNVREQGITSVIDVNDTHLFPRHIINFPSATLQNHQPRSILKGLLNHSHSSLESLVLNDFTVLQPTIDLHQSLPNLRKLRRLDISRILSITDDTLNLISSSIGKRLEVLYMKGLHNVTNAGIVHLFESCTNLRVLDISEVHQLNDEAGKAIGHHLTKLEVIHCKDNYKLTNDSVDIITKNCKNLVQITLWGNIHLKHVNFSGEEDMETSHTTASASLPRPPSLSDFLQTPSKLIILNLWGCHNIDDAKSFTSTCLPHLHSLCLSECHRLTDDFLGAISLPQLVHLKLRYVRRITDTSLETISQMMPVLYSLDLSFCTKLTISGVCRLITACPSMSELRLYACRQLNIGNVVSPSHGGRQLARALKNSDSSVSFLDVRECHSQFELPASRPETYSKSMLDLGFDETLTGIFIRPARWSDRIGKQLVSNLR